MGPDGMNRRKFSDECRWRRDGRWPCPGRSTACGRGRARFGGPRQSDCSRFYVSSGCRPRTTFWPDTPGTKLRPQDLTGAARALPVEDDGSSRGLSTPARGSNTTASAWTTASRSAPTLLSSRRWPTRSAAELAQPLGRRPLAGRQRDELSAKVCAFPGIYESGSIGAAEVLRHPWTRRRLGAQGRERGGHSPVQVAGARPVAKRAGTC